jgi:hypothetical protein
MRSHAILGLTATVAAASLLGCSISASSWSLSKSGRSSSHSSDSSSSSSPGAAERAYRDDVADYTRAFVKSQRGDFAGFQADLAHLAEEHGITNWEANPATYTAIGEGLANAKVSDAGLMAYKRNLSVGDSQKARLIQQGYDSAR